MRKTFRSTGRERLKNKAAARKQAEELHDIKTVREKQQRSQESGRFEAAMLVLVELNGKLMGKSLMLRSQRAKSQGYVQESRIPQQLCTSEEGVAELKHV